MFGTQFYNETTRRYTAIFGTLFNDITITRNDNSDTQIQRMKVPLSYGPSQKFLARLDQDPDLNAPAMVLPRMSFELMDMTYNGERKLPVLQRNSVPTSANTSIYSSVMSPAPYDLEFQLNIMTKYSEDALKIVEQIIPYFKPEFTPSVKVVDDLEYYLDVPIVLNSITHEEVYEGDFTERRAILWTLSFTMKGWYFGPTQSKKVIKFVKVNMYANTAQANADMIVTTQPGMTANGVATTDINETIDWSLISGDDDWDYIVQVTDRTNE